MNLIIDLANYEAWEINNLCYQVGIEPVGDEDRWYLPGHVLIEPLNLPITQPALQLVASPIHSAPDQVSLVYLPRLNQLMILMADSLDLESISRENLWLCLDWPGNNIVRDFKAITSKIRQWYGLELLQSFQISVFVASEITSRSELRRIMTEMVKLAVTELPIPLTSKN